MEKIKRFAMTVANKRVLLLPDNDEEGEAGFRDLLWDLVDAGLRVQLGWSRERNHGRYEGLQPEHISQEIWDQIARELAS